MVSLITDRYMWNDEDSEVQILQIQRNKRTTDSVPVFNYDYYIPAEQVANILGYEDTTLAIERHVNIRWVRLWGHLMSMLKNSSDKTLKESYDALSVPSHWRFDTRFVSVVGVYALIVHSDDATRADGFHTWFFDSVLSNVISSTTMRDIMLGIFDR
ncbi:bro12 [Heliothis virescens ascovirus 3h]|uniref:Bro12 n=1 Tax=Heliothis virescens ascovirus 3h TaxID=1268039 RepID=A0A386JAX0_9VIRU|nr:bro12 [Heliothis virescens ascovirus 3h]